MIKKSIREITIVYISHLFMGVFFTGLLLLELFNAVSNNLAVSQGLSMVIILPLSLVAIVAFLIALALSLKNTKDWRQEKGMGVLFGLMMLVLVVLIYDESQVKPDVWLTSTVESVYSFFAFYFSIKWFKTKKIREG